jgi:nucleoside-diphosphate-sugar epimerase
MLTGASGFLGTHIAQCLLDRGHQVRALVRTPANLRESLTALGVDPDDRRIDVVVGDMTDPGAAREAVTGCDQAVLAAATYSYRRPDAERMLRENTLGTTTVLDAAAGAGCSGIVHVSSVVALLRSGATLDHRSPLGVPIGPYSRSKVESERAARARQEAGAPITIVNPGGVIGPHDPTLGETNETVRDIRSGGCRPGHVAGCSGWTSETPRTGWWRLSVGPGGATSSLATRSRSRTRRSGP